MYENQSKLQCAISSVYVYLDARSFARPLLDFQMFAPPSKAIQTIENKTLNYNLQFVHRALKPRSCLQYLIYPRELPDASSLTTPTSHFRPE